MVQKLTPKLIKQRMTGERVSLVGGAGFIGHNLALALRNVGAEVQIIDNLMQNNMLANVSDDDIDPFRRELNHSFLVQRFEKMRISGVTMDNADARSMIDLAEKLKEFQPTKVVHLAAISSAVDAKRVPGHCFDLQLVTLRNVLEYTRLFKNEINEVVFMSSSTVYGDFKTETVEENVRPQPYGIYANAKFMGERLIRTYHDQYLALAFRSSVPALYTANGASLAVSARHSLKMPLWVSHSSSKVEATGVLISHTSKIWSMASCVQWQPQAAPIHRTHLT